MIFITTVLFFCGSLLRSLCSRASTANLRYFVTA